MWDRLLPDAPPAAESLATVSVWPSPQSTEYVQSDTEFEVLFCRNTVSPVSAVVITLPPSLVAEVLIANAATGAADATVM